MKTLRTALLYFDQAVRDGSIRRAAENLHIASSALNRQLLLLEEEIGLPLFERLPRGIRATSAGELLLAHVRRWRREAQAVDHEIRSLMGGVRGTIRIAAAESITEHVLPRALCELQLRFPLIDYSVISGDNNRITSELLSKEADIVVAFDVKENRRGEVVHMITSPIGVIACNGHPLMEKNVLTLADCADHGLIVPGADWLQASGLGVLLQRRDAPPRIVARAERPGMLKAMVRAGLGIAFLTRFGVEFDTRQMRLEWRPLAPGTISPATISVMVPRGSVTPVYVGVLIEILKRMLDEVATPA